MSRDLEFERTAHAFMAAWCDDFQRAMTWLCSPEPTVTIPLKEYERLKAGYGVGQLEQQMRGQPSPQWQGTMGQGAMIPRQRPEFNEHWRRP